jgi:predicted DNA binding CopG/RHH family protein
MSARKPKSLPTFTSEDQERSFWAKHDSTEYVQWSQGQRRSFPNLRPTLRTISLRLPESMLGQLKVLANKRDMPYQSLLKQFLAERLQKELSKGSKSLKRPPLHASRPLL